MTDLLTQRRIDDAAQRLIQAGITPEQLAVIRDVFADLGFKVVRAADR